MKSKESDISEQYRLQEWYRQIQECQNRPEEMSVPQWCALQGITKACYYYRMRRVRKAFLEKIEENPCKYDSISAEKEIVPVSPNLIMEPTDGESTMDFSVEIQVSDCKIRLHNSVSTELLRKVMEVVRDAQ